jgi:hypothetical protein
VLRRSSSGRRETPASGRGGRAELRIAGFDDAAVVGRGGFATVYRARQVGLGRVVAVKVLSVVDLDERAVRRFEREGVALGALAAHPNIVTVYASGITDAGAPYLAMEYLPRGSLADRLEAEGPLGWQEVVPIGIKLAGALETAHRAGMLHRDIKPENVLMSNFGEPQLADFGIARFLAGPQTRTSGVELSVPHAPPEVLEGRQPTERSDVYSLGSTLFTLLWGASPFVRDTDESLIAVLARIAAEPPPDLRTRGVPDAVAGVVERAMAKDPADRHATALDLALDLQAVQRAASEPPTPVPIDIVTAAPGPEPAPVAVEPPEPEPGAGGEPAAGGEEDLTRRVRVPPAALPPGSGWAGDRKRAAWVLGGAVAAVAALVAVGLALASGGAERDRDRAGGTAATTSPTDPPTSAPPPTAAPVALPAVAGPLAAGHYVATGFTPPLGFRLGEGWDRRLPGGGANVVELHRADLGGILSLVRVQQVLSPTHTFATGADLGAAGAVQEAPADLVGWLRDHPRLQVGPPATTTVGSLPAVRVEVTVRDGYPSELCPGSDECVVLFGLGDITFLLSEGFANDIYVFGPEGGRVVAVVEAPTSSSAAFRTTAGEVLATVELRP